MELKEVLRFADNVVLTKTGKHLNDLQRDILEETLQGSKYNVIADKHECTVNYVREVAATLWKILSEEVGEKITQSNIRTTLERASYSIISSNFYPNSQTHINICSSDLKSLKNSQTKSAEKPYLDLDDAPHRTLFHGRTKELDTLQNWILQQHYHLIMITGMAGIGKTALTLELIEQIKNHFDVVLWRDLHDFPEPENLEKELIEILSDGPLTSAPQKEENTNNSLRYLAKLLRKHRCLIVLDSLQSLLQDGQLAGNYQNPNYQTFFKFLSKIKQNSCFIINSWETPQDIVYLAEKYPGVSIFSLKGLGKDAQSILKEKDLNNQENWEKLIYLYQGNPLYLKLVATLLNQLFNSQITISQTENCLLPEELQMILSTQIERLSPLEKEILTYLAINDNQYSLNQLLDIFNLPKNQIINTFQSLMRRTLIEQNSATSEIENNYTVAPIFKEYLKNVDN
jgi:AAA+ ATPase superfamily predicted ATPase